MLDTVQAPDAAAIPAFDDALRDIVGTTRVQKIGEGTFKEVYRCQHEVITTMPIDGDMLVNDAPQQQAGEVLGELLVLGALSALSRGNLSCGAVSGVLCFQGLWVCGMLCFVTNLPRTMIRRCASAAVVITRT
jgi:hypothetical protein